MGIGPVPSTEVALGKAGLSLSDIDLIELNEAFAAQALAVMREWGFTDADRERTNVHGSGISLGHPVGATGGRMLCHAGKGTDAARSPLRAGNDVYRRRAGSGRGVRKGWGMSRIAQTLGLTEFQTEIVANVRQFVDKEIIPHAQELEHADTYPQAIVDQMREMGLFGLMIPEEYGGPRRVAADLRAVRRGARAGLDERLRCDQHALHRRVHAAPARNRCSRSSASCPEWPPVRARGAFSMSEPELGSDVAAIRTRR